MLYLFSSYHPGIMKGLSCRSCFIWIIFAISHLSTSDGLTSCSADIVFLIDQSSSVRSINFKIQLSFVKSIVSELAISPDLIQVSVCLFSTSVTNEFWLNTYKDNSSIITAIGKIPYGGGGTFTGKALTYVLNNNFTPARGARSGAQSLLILMTDGISQDSVDQPALNLEAAAIRVLSIGISSLVDQNTLTLISRDSSLVYILSDFDSLPSIVSNVIGSVCKDVDECTSNPCYNGASCRDQVNGFLCDCVSGYNGSTCAEEINECMSSPCQNNATCQDFLNYFVCNCLNGSTGTFCETSSIDECQSSPCKNNAKCHFYMNEFTCECVDGYSGILCETDINECQSDPCRKGGICTDHVNYFSCGCVDGYTGTLCETDINECASNPCNNGTTCLDLLNYYTCYGPGAEPLSEINANECLNNSCLNGGTCRNQSNNFTCVCVPGYNGFLCGREINECISKPCQNNGTCMDHVNYFSCACKDGYTGATCETNLYQCPSSSCQNGGSCIGNVTSSSCSCVLGFTGSFCETDVDECASIPCLNDGTCQDHVSKYTCICHTGFSGDNCEAVPADTFNQIIVPSIIVVTSVVAIISLTFCIKLCCPKKALYSLLRRCIMQISRLTRPLRHRDN